MPHYSQRRYYLLLLLAVQLQEFDYLVNFFQKVLLKVNEMIYYYHLQSYFLCLRSYLEKNHAHLVLVLALINQQLVKFLFFLILEILVIIIVLPLYLQDQSHTLLFRLEITYFNFFNLHHRLLKVYHNMIIKLPTCMLDY